MTRAEVVARARSWCGTRWQHQGRLQGVGVDCVGLIAEAGRDVLSVDEAANYQRRPDGVTLKAKLEQYLTPIALADIQPGDVLLFATSGRPDHVGLVGDYPAAGELSLIHAYVKLRKVVEHRLDDHWKRQAVAAYRIPGLG